ncbi:MAG: hypothetical protein Q7J10_05490 [Methanosarcinaceae archaeon]|nr:hypothetical protein [Methanosarcinaceae archaeon]
MNVKKILLLILLFSIIAFSGCLGENGEINKDILSSEDFKINTGWNLEFIAHFHTDPNMNPLIPSDSIHDEFALNVESYHEGLVFYKVYDKLKGFELHQFYDNQVYDLDNQVTMSINKGNKNDLYTVNLDSIEDQKEIEVYFSLDENFDITDEGVVNLSTFLPQRKLDFEVDPSTIKFTISKSVFPPSDIRTITIENTGDAILRIGVYPPYDPFDLPYRPQYVRGEGFGEMLSPGEIRSYEIISLIDAKETPVGVYQTYLIVGTLFDYNPAKWESVSSDTHFTKRYSLETTVTK